jgi:phosphopantothenoylcysteine synthetase/decarboxylase
MNGKMWLHSATQANVKLLKKRGVQFIGPDSGMLACGYEGVGRLWPADEIARLVLKKISAPKMRALQKKSAALMRSRAK